MIVLANEEFATGLRLAGLKSSYIIEEKKKALEILEKTDKKALIIVTEKVLEMVPELEEYQNVVTFPDKLHDFSKIDDLKRITKIAIGSEVDI